MPKQYFVYIVTNKANTVIYTGVTSALPQRVYAHQKKLVSGFTSRYNVNKLVYYETYPDIRDALEREKQIKAGPRWRKIKLIQQNNPDFKDLSKEL